MFAEFLNRDEFFEKYMLNLATRMAIGNVEMESSPGTISEQYLDIYNNIDAFTYLVNGDIDRLVHLILKSVQQLLIMKYMMVLGRQQLR